MDFFIKQNSSLPILKLQISKDGRSDFNKIMEIFSSSTIQFSMVDVETGIPRVMRKFVTTIIDNSTNGVSPENIFIYIKLSHKDTKKVGKYKIQINLENSDGILTLPIQDDIFVYVLESFILDNFSFDNNGFFYSPCCFYYVDNFNYLITNNDGRLVTQDGYFIVVLV